MGKYFISGKKNLKNAKIEKQFSFFLFKLSVLLILFSQCLCNDWTFNCPNNCTCKWSNGKKSAICNKIDLKTVPKNLSTEIQVIALNENHISYLNGEEFTSLGLINLQKIYLKNSKVKYVHRDAFKNLKILIEIDLSDNQIEKFDQTTFTGNDRLRILLLTGNPLKQLVDYQFSRLPHLRVLDLSNCFLEKIDKTSFNNLEFLDFLNLNKNLLENLPETTFNHMTNLKTLEIDENPWRCDCNLRLFKNWFFKSNLNNVNLKCHQPIKLKGRTWESIKEEQFGCGPTLILFNSSYSNVELGDNVTYSCSVSGDPKPNIKWKLNGLFLENKVIKNVLIKNSDQWSNLTIVNVTKMNNGRYSCFANNSINFVLESTNLQLPEKIELNLENSSNDDEEEPIRYLGIIFGTFTTSLSLILFCIFVYLCNKKKRKKSIQKVYFTSDQNKKLLSNNEQQKTKIVSSIEQTEQPIHQIIIENIPPPNEYLTQNTLPSLEYGNIFISVPRMDNEILENSDQNMCPDLLNLPFLSENEVHKCSTCLINQTQTYIKGEDFMKCDSPEFRIGRRTNISLESNKLEKINERDGY